MPRKTKVGRSYPEKKLDRVRQNSNKVRQKLDRNLKIIG